MAAPPPPSYADSTEKKPGYPPNPGYTGAPYQTAPAPYPSASAPYPQPGYSAPYPPAQPTAYNSNYGYPGAQPPATGFVEPKPAPMPSAGHNSYSGYCECNTYTLFFHFYIYPF